MIAEQRTVLRDSTSTENILPEDVLDVFSPLKRKEIDSADDSERKEKRLKESTNKLEKSTRGVSKRFSTLVDTDRKKDDGIRVTRRDEMRLKERDMEKEAMKALTSKRAVSCILL
jgi:hypothetical protein